MRVLNILHIQGKDENNGQNSMDVSGLQRSTVGTTRTLTVYPDDPRAPTYQHLDKESSYLHNEKLHIQTEEEFKPSRLKCDPVFRIYNYQRQYNKRLSTVS